MSRYSQLGFFCILAGCAMALPQGQPQGHRFSWTGTLGSPMSFPAPTLTSNSLSATTSATSSTTKTSSSTYHIPSSMSSRTSTTSFSRTSTTTLSTSQRTTTSSTASPSATTTASSGKRGIAYNDASYAALYKSSSQVTWGYNWWSDAAGLPSSYDFAPMLWGSASGFTDPWPTNVANMLETGTTHLLSFNEPDLSSQSNMTSSEAAAAYMKYMQPYASKAKLGSPAITNGGGTMGLYWLSEFMDACSDCQIDFVPLHWYNNPGTNDDFKAHITAAYQAFSKPIWITEFGLNNPTDDEAISFLEDVLPWLDQQHFVERYAYFMTAENFLVDSVGIALSKYGSVYASYSS